MDTSKWIGPAIFMVLLLRSPTGRSAEKEINIGVAESTIQQVEKAKADAAITSLGTAIEEKTKLAGKYTILHSPLALGQQLTQGHIQLALLTGFEFAWAQRKYPSLRPFIIAVNQDRHLHAHVLVKNDDTTTEMKGLKGKTLIRAKVTKPHCKLFLQRSLGADGTTPEEFFSGIKEADTVEDALDDVVDGVATAALVDGVSLSRFRTRKPARYAKLKEIAKSPAFPATVIAYCEGKLDESTRDLLKGALLDLGKSEGGKQTLLLWKMTAFENVPQDYDQDLRAIEKRYPFVEKSK